MIFLRTVQVIHGSNRNHILPVKFTSQPSAQFYKSPFQIQIIFQTKSSTIFLPSPFWTSSHMCSFSIHGDLNFQNIDSVIRHNLFTKTNSRLYFSQDSRGKVSLILSPFLFHFFLMTTFFLLSIARSIIEVFEYEVK